MNSSNDGLTVGELTIGIGVLFLVVIIWSAVVKRDNSNQSYLPTSNEALIVDKNMIF